MIFQLSRKSKLVSFLLCAAFAAAALSTTATAAADTEFAEGMKAYKVKKYQAASDHFGKSIQQGNKTATVWLMSAHCFVALGQLARANQTYLIVTQSFKGSEEAKSAAASIEAVKARGGTVADATSGKSAVPAQNLPETTPAKSATPTPSAPGNGGLLGRITVIAPLFGHPAVSQATINAAKEAVNALPAPLRKKLDDDPDARIALSPNMVDRYPESLKDLPEDTPALNMAELPGRIYGKDMNIYERAKKRGSNVLKEARPPKYIRLQVANMCFQVLDEMMTISKDEALRKEWEADRDSVPAGQTETLATFLKDGDWGPKETCAELFGSMLGGFDENTEALYRYFPRTKRYLQGKMGVK